ncbi:PAN domain-containing protein At5g03700-like [Aristolochia californica]|uniref:PAN domain-containing protein At5g03700-like n=1 Tax=Aristolochia californica TaxID=171875 RepID=UPI0035DD87AD
MKKEKLSCILLSFLFLSTASQVFTTPTEIHRGFSVVPDPSISGSQILLADSSSDFSLSFLRLGSSHLALAVVHSPSGEPVWLANPERTARWSSQTTLSFNGDLVLSDAPSGVFWSSKTDGERLRLRSGNLQVLGPSSSVLWQSFDFPTDTLLVNQNFTANMTLRSPNGLYSMMVEHDYLSLFAEFERGTSQLYWKRTAMQTKAQIVDGLGPIYARVDPNGFLGLYQTEKALVDVLAFSTYYRAVNGTRRLQMESDGNLRAYYWNSGKWVLDFSAIQAPCGLPSECGPYGLCHPDAGCTCLDDRVKYGPGGCCPEFDDFCQKDKKKNQFQVVQRTDVDVKYKTLVASEKAVSAEECSRRCIQNCRCWAALYSNSSEMCYRVDFPVRTVVASVEVGKVAFFKVRRREKEVRVGVAGVWGFICGAAVLSGVAGLVAYGVWRWRRQRRSNGLLSEEGLEPGPYRDLKEREIGVELYNKK